eukprot:TRINITY_DN5514_c0_g1_i1.p1 TRINITY_DN5514_c0_g1~~TRINITY_DN5514_c0_g1_i1.p1  ORF type:complete len:197 (+),score=31.57 TRINITY_DN5514_c0_g1_i1:107-697(+)
MAVRSERDVMLAGEAYNAGDAELVALRKRSRELTRAYNTSLDDPHSETQRARVKELIGKVDGEVYIEPPFRCDYGSNIELGNGVYMNFDCVILDVCKVRIGANTLMAPGVHIYAATHPIDPVPRRAGVEMGKPVTIGENVWLGGRVVVCPGVSIGDNCVIGAGSVVTKDIPANVVAVGNPCKVLRPVTADDRSGQV